MPTLIHFLLLYITMVPVSASSPCIALTVPIREVILCRIHILPYVYLKLYYGCDTPVYGWSPRVLLSRCWEKSVILLVPSIGMSNLLNLRRHVSKTGGVTSIITLI